MKKITITILTMILLILGTTAIYGANAYNISIVPSKQELLPGEEIIVTFRIENIEEEPGIGAIYGKLEYDKKIFEKVKQEDFAGVEGWEEPIYNDENEREGALFLLREMGDTIKEDSNIFSIKMKVLDKVPTKNTQIKLTQISSSTGEKDIETQDALVKCSVQGNTIAIETIWIYIAIGAVALIIAIIIIALHLKNSKKK